MSENPEFEPLSGWFADKRDFGGFSEDLTFCYLAMRSGVQLYAHTGIQLGHCGDPEVVTRETYERKKLDFKVLVPNGEERVQWGRR